MAAAKRYRWTCPQCGVGALAGKAPRKDATVRFCLPCSAKSTTLVERTCPALDRERETAEGRRRAKAKRQREVAASKRKAAKRRAEKAKAERDTAVMDWRWPSDAGPAMTEEMAMLAEHSRASVIKTTDGILHLRIQGPHGTAKRSSPHSREALAVLIDYAVHVGHPDAETMHGTFVRLTAPRKAI